MPKRILWTERLFQLFPIGKERGNFASFLKVRLVRSLCFALIFGLVGFPFYWGAGITANALYAGSLVAMLYFLSVLFLVFVVSGWFHTKWDWFFGWSRHVLELSETEFGKFRDRMEKFINSFLACLGLAVIFAILGMIPAMGIFMEEFAPLMLRPTVMLVYLGFTNSFMMLLLGTLIWMILSLWITFYVTLRQPLKLRLSLHTDEEFRPLAIWSLKVLFITFMLVAIFVVFKDLGVLIVPGGIAGAVVTLTFFMTMGVLAFLLPFYHIHRVLVKLKKRELLEIEEESNKLMQDLAQAASKNHALHSEDRMMQIMNTMASLQVLQIRERRAKEADEWPIDTTILSIMTGIVLVPIISQIIINLLSTIFAS